jgi:acylphosphatase
VIPNAPPGRSQFWPLDAEIAAGALYLAARDKSSGAEVICRKYMVGGRVQGVFYRATVQRHARALRIVGYARNLPDGRVEVLACGTEEALEAFVKGLWAGSSASKVTAVEVGHASITAADGPTDFLTA